MMRLTIIGFGNQAKSWAQNLKDSNFPVRVALKAQSHSMGEAKKLGFEVVEIGTKEFYEDQFFALLIPDQSHIDFLNEYGSSLRSDSVMLYAHGFSVMKHELQNKFPKVQHVLFAPKAIGSELRRQYQLKGKLGAVYSLEFFKGDHTSVEKWVSQMALALGINMGPFKTSFKRETEADLYSEQGLLCSLVPYAAGELFAHLVESGTEPELAYFECWHELKLIVNAMVDKGPEGFFDLISPNALIGSEKGYQKLFTKDFQNNLKSLLVDIQSGKFNQEIDAADVEQTRKVIRERWQKSPLNKTFNSLNQDLK